MVDTGRMSGNCFDFYFMPTRRQMVFGFIKCDPFDWRCFRRSQLMTCAFTFGEKPWDCVPLRINTHVQSSAAHLNFNASKIKFHAANITCWTCTVTTCSQHIPLRWYTNIMNTSTAPERNAVSVLRCGETLSLHELNCWIRKMLTLWLMSRTRRHSRAECASNRDEMILAFLRKLFF